MALLRPAGRDATDNEGDAKADRARLRRRLEQHAPGSIQQGAPRKLHPANRCGLLRGLIVLHPPHMIRSFPSRRAPRGRCATERSGPLHHRSRRMRRLHMLCATSASTALPMPPARQMPRCRHGRRPYYPTCPCFACRSECAWALPAANWDQLTCNDFGSCFTLHVGFRLPVSASGCDCALTRLVGGSADVAHMPCGCGHEDFAGTCLDGNGVRRPSCGRRCDRSQSSLHDGHSRLQGARAPSYLQEVVRWSM